MSTENETRKNLVRNALLPLFAGGLCVPLFIAARPAANALLGAYGLGSLVLITGFIAMFAPRVPRNFRIGFALLTAGGVYSIALVTSKLLPLSGVPIASLAPLLVIAGVLAGDNPAYYGKKRTSQAIVDGGLIGLCFMAGLVTLGAARDLVFRIMAGSENPAGWRSIPVVFVLVAASVFIIEIMAKFKRSAP